MEKPKLPKALPYAMAVIVIGLIVIVLVAGLPSSIPTEYSGEIRSYQGEGLSAIAEVQANEISGLQDINHDTYRLVVNGTVKEPLELTYSEVINNYPSYLRVATIYCVEGWEAKILWEGVQVKDLLLAADANMSAPVVIFYASDGYSTALPMSYIVDNNILLAYKMNNVTMPPERGFPFELVAENQYGYKWIKWITQIEVSQNENYLGYWERRGYPNNATLR
ncbi:MAG: molybdopterin-dependent oxidoreductase [Candidatus Bathyarchaeia archaeon]|jgi:DMSO/TMAO reductase YedYZ molybdopterin-dependent catalytic subunit